MDCGRGNTFHQHSRVSPKDLILDVEKKKSRRPVDISGFASSVQTTVCEEGGERKETHRRIQLMSLFCFSFLFFLWVRLSVVNDRVRSY